MRRHFLLDIGGAHVREDFFQENGTLAHRCVHFSLGFIALHGVFRDENEGWRDPIL